MIAGMGFRNFVEVPKEAIKEAIQVTVPCAICGSTDHSVQHIFPEEHFDRHFLTPTRGMLIWVWNFDWLNVQTVI